MNIPQPGQKAPNFTAIDQDENQISLSDFSDWIVLYFYPKNDTPGCTTEAKDFTELSQFAELKAKIFGVSTDSTKSHCRFIKKHNYINHLIKRPRT